MEHFADLGNGAPLSVQESKDMIEVMKELCETKQSPIESFLRIRLELMSLFTGVQILDLPRLQDLVLQELKSILADLYGMARLLFPVLPEDWDHLVNISGSTQ